jgi:hypothetical protein
MTLLTALKIPSNFANSASPGGEKVLKKAKENPFLSPGEKALKKAKGDTFLSLVEKDTPKKAPALSLLKKKGREEILGADQKILEHLFKEGITSYSFKRKKSLDPEKKGEIGLCASVTTPTYTRTPMDQERPEKISDPQTPSRIKDLGFSQTASLVPMTPAHSKDLIALSFTPFKEEPLELSQAGFSLCEENQHLFLNYDEPTLRSDKSLNLEIKKGVEKAIETVSEKAMEDGIKTAVPRDGDKPPVFGTKSIDDDPITPEAYRPLESTAASPKAQEHQAQNPLEKNPTIEAYKPMQFIQPAHHKPGLLKLELSPAHLGKVDVSVTIAQDGRIDAVVEIEKSEAFYLLSQNARELQQVIADSFDQELASFDLSMGQESSHKDEESEFYHPQNLLALNEQEEQETTGIHELLLTADHTRAMDHWV